MRFAGIEAGGTKCVLGVGRGPDAIEAMTTLPTRSPSQTLADAISWFAQQGPVDALGIASFGPVQLDRRAANWGHITRTTKAGWSDTSVAPVLGRALGVPVGFDTDVNGAALAEARWGAGRSCRSLVYVTVGTGIGGGAVYLGAALQGATHPEMGHVRLARHADDRDFPGVCSYHGDCLEGLASGPAIAARWGVSLSDLPADHPAHEIIAWYLGQLSATLQAMFAPERIILGGGVMNTPGLFDRVVIAARSTGRDYFAIDPADLLARPGLGGQSGLLGALILAEQALAETGGDSGIG